VADDALQRVCLVALQKPPRRRTGGEADLRAWLVDVTRKRARQARRSEPRRRRREQRVAMAESLPATVDVAARRELLRLFVDAVTGLPEPALHGRPPPSVTCNFVRSPETDRALANHRIEQLRRTHSRHAWDELPTPRFVRLRVCWDALQRLSPDTREKHLSVRHLR